MNALRRLVAFYRLQLHLLWTWRPGRVALVRRASISFLVSAGSLGFAIWLLPGIRAADWSAIARAVVLIGVLNLAVRPVLLAVLAPFTPLVLAVATLLWQVLLFFSLGAWVDGVFVDGLATAFLASWVYAVVNTLLTGILATDGEETFWGALVRQLARSRTDVIETDRPGVVFVQIDGLAHPVLAHQVRAGRVPVIARWIRSGGMRLDRWVALLPSQTSASQAGILHGNNRFIPAFRWWDKSQGRMLVSNRPADAAEIGRRASDGEGLLSNDGASIGNLVSGDAARSYMTMATILDRGQGLGRSQTFYSFFASPYNYLHTVVLTIAEIAKEYVQATRARRRGIVPSMHRGMPYPVARAGTNIALRALSTSLVMEEMWRGTPVIYVDYTDYDEIAHHSGPERAEALDALDGLDRVIGSLVRVAEETPRPYRFVLLSDHGQSLGATFRQRYGRTLAEVIGEFMGGAIETHAAEDLAERWGPLNAALTEAAQTGGTAGAITRRATSRRTSEGAVDMGAGRRAAPGQARVPAAPDAPGSAPTPGAPDTRANLPELAVAASGNLALVYFPRLPGRLTLEEIEAAWPGLVAALAGHPGIGFLMVRSAAHGAVAIGADGAHYLAEARVTGTDPLARFGPHARTGLLRLDAMDHCGDIVALSMVDDETDEVAAFEELIGSHGGVGGPQTEAFLLHPAEWTVDEPLVGAEAVYRQLRRWLEGAGIPLGRRAEPPA